MSDAAELACRFHETYERLAPEYGYRTHEESAKPWADIPAQNRVLMVAVCAELLASDVRVVDPATHVVVERDHARWSLSHADEQGDHVLSTGLRAVLNDGRAR